MGRNKIVYGDVTLIDLSNDTVTPDKLFKDETCHDRHGDIITGIAEFVDTYDATATADDILRGATAYAIGEKIIGNIETRELSTPTIEMENGAITATVEQAKGYISQATSTTASLSVPTVSVPAPSISVSGAEIAATVQMASGFTPGGTVSASFSQATVNVPSPVISVDGTAVTATVDMGSGYTNGGTKQSSYSIPAVAQAVPSIAVGTDGKITATAEQVAGYVAGGSTSAAFQMATQAAATITPTESTQTAIASQTFATGAVSVAPIPSSYVQPSGTLSITENGSYSVASYASANVNVSGGGGGISVDDVAERKISGAMRGNASIVSDFAFQGCLIDEASFPLVETIGASAFRSCANLSEISFPSCESVGSYAFRDCTALESAYFPAAVSFGASAFQGCTSLTHVSFPLCESLGASIFRECANLKTIYAPLISSAASNVFAGLANLESVTLSSVTTIGAATFRSCTRLIELHLENVSSVPTLMLSVFSSTPIGGYSTVAGRYGSVFVPASLYDSFLAGGNWGSVSARIVSVS